MNLNENLFHTNFLNNSLEYFVYDKNGIQSNSLQNVGYYYAIQYI